MGRPEDTRPGRGARRPVAAGLWALTASLASLPTLAADGPNDPLERLNRATFAFNDALDRMLARPAAKAYRAVVPAPARQAVGNFVANLEYPTVIVNDALQAKFKDAGTDTVRFLANSVIGLGGLFDPATHFGLAIHDEDFGQTLGRWGVPPGPYFMLPILGPSDFRDAPSRLVDHYTSGDYWVTTTRGSPLFSTKAEYALWALRSLDTRTTLLATDEALKQAFDRYAVVRNAYVSRREYLVRDGNMPEETYDEPPAEAPPAATPQKIEQQPDEPPKAPSPPPESPPRDPP